MKTAKSMINLREHSLLTRPKEASPDDMQLEVNANVYRRVCPPAALPQRRVVQAQIREMKLPSQTSGFGYDYYDTARAVVPASPRAVRFGRQDTCDLRAETHALKTVLLKPEESFVRFIHEGGSGAKPYVVQRPDGQEVLRKLMLAGSFKKQDEEAKGEEAIRGFGRGDASALGVEPDTVKEDPRIAAVLQDGEKVDLLQKFIRETRPNYFSRYVATLREPGKNRVYASFFDQEFVRGSEFAKAISHNNEPLSEEQLNTLVQAQLDILETFYEYQSQIFVEPVDTPQKAQESGDYYLDRLQSRLLTPLRTGEFEQVLLSLPSEDLSIRSRGQLLSDPAGGPHFSLAALLTQKQVTINGQHYENPVPQLETLIRNTPSPYLGWSMHGDPQQTNFLLQAPLFDASGLENTGLEKSETDTSGPEARGMQEKGGSSEGSSAKLLCIDNRPAQITPYSADLEKALWGAGWVPLFQGDEQVKHDVSQQPADGLRFMLGPRPGAQRSVENFRHFEHRLQGALKRAPWFQKLLNQDPTLPQRLHLASVTQCLCDIGIAVKRLAHARNAILEAGPDLDLHGTQSLIQMLTERIVGDFLRACQNYDRYQQNEATITDYRNPSRSAPATLPTLAQLRIF